LDEELRTLAAGADRKRNEDPWPKIKEGSYVRRRLRGDMENVKYSSLGPRWSTEVWRVLK
jgi:hypothetical protein